MSQRLHHPRTFCEAEQRLDADLHIVCVAWPTALEQPGVSEPRSHVRDEDILDGTSSCDMGSLKTVVFSHSRKCCRLGSLFPRQASAARWINASIRAVAL